MYLELFKLHMYAGETPNSITSGIKTWLRGKHYNKESMSKTGSYLHKFNHYHIKSSYPSKPR